jgi:Dolichyl-phosphate-mannose-protein mannosyltransferase
MSTVYPGESTAFGRLQVWLQSHALLASLLLLACALGPRLNVAISAPLSDLIVADSGSYLAPAQNLVRQGAYLDRHLNPEVTRTPGYPVFLAAMIKFAGPDMRRVVIVQAAVLSLGVVIVYWLARHVLPPVPAFCGAMIAALSPWSTALAGMVLTEGLFICVLAMIFLFMKLADEATDMPAVLGWSAALGLSTAAAILVRPIWPLLLLVGVAVVLMFGPLRKKTWLALAVVIVTGATPPALWTMRNAEVAGFHGLSDNAGKTVWRGLASRVKSELTGQDRFGLERATQLDDSVWPLSVEAADAERWRRAKALFHDHPVLTVSSFLRSAAEHMVHPSPDVLGPAKLNFHGDYWVLGLLWAGMVCMACAAFMPVRDDTREVGGPIERSWLVMMLAMCLFLTLASGVAFGAGSRYRAPLEVIIPLLTGTGILRLFRYRTRVTEARVSFTAQ